MGKGKGSRNGTRARVWVGSTLVAFSSIRPGLFNSLRRRYQVRCQFRIVGISPEATAQAVEFPVFCGTPTLGGLRLRGVQRGYITQQLRTFRDRLKRLRRPHFTSYFLRIF